MSANGTDGDASKSRQIPEYVQRNFKLNQKLGIDAVEKTTAGHPTTAGHQTTRRSFLSCPSLVGDPVVADREAGASNAIDPSPADMTSYRAYINKQDSTPQTSSAAIDMFKAYTSERERSSSYTGPQTRSKSSIRRPYVSDPLPEGLQEPRHVPALPRLGDGNLIASEGEGSDHTTQPPKSKLQQYADEVYQNTVVQYLERVRRGEETVPTDQDRHNNRIWIASYSAWVARQNSNVDEEGPSEPQSPRKGG
ncbi:hypothetical protein IWX49DRAFT_557414 [Phyllosticta citricarpa]|uniref:Uncharacterized protein n=1 Tax=Phyllosticta citricarpa TaxID=55181 RepID=A0ABR1M743_9PEZI